MEDDLIYIDIEKEMLTSRGRMTLSLNAEIKKGRLIALFGDSGAGKTTLLRILSGLIAPDKGMIRFGKEIWFDSEKKINIRPQERNVSLMFQDYALFPNMTIEKNIEFAQPEKNRQQIDQLLSVFGLEEFRKRKPGSLSGGQRQRVALARAIARKPRLLLLDEPLSALDAEMRILLQDEIAKAHHLSGATTLLVSHDLHEVFRLAHHVLCIENGRITRRGDPDTVFTDSSVSGKVQITGQIARIERQETVNLVTVISGNNQIVKVIAFDEDLKDLHPGDQVMVYTKAFNPIIRKILFS